MNNHQFDYISFGDNLPVVEYMIENKMRCDTARVNTGLIKAKKLMIRLVNGGVTNDVIQSKPVEIEELKEYCK